MKFPTISLRKWRREDPAEELRIFTEHVRALAAGEDPSRHLEPLWEALHTALRSELKRRGLWEVPPSFLGVYGWERWDSGGGARAGASGAFEELLAECYAFVFVSRLAGLQAQLKVKPNVDGLVFLNIRHFLHERQVEHDPIGAQTFAVLQSAVRLAIADGELRVLRGDERIRNDTILAFGTGTDAAQLNGRIGAIVARWNDELLPDLLTLRGRKQEGVVLRLRALLSELAREGIEVFRFKDLVDPLKADARTRWGALLEREQGEGLASGRGEVVRVVRPNVQVEERQLFRKLVECVVRAVERLDVNEKTRGYLSRLWQFLRIQAVEGSTRELAANLKRSLAAELEEEGDDPPSRRRVAELLDIPRERLEALYRTLGGLLEDCRVSVARPGAWEGRTR